MTVLVEQTHSLSDFETGRILLSPFRGSRIMPGQKEKAAPDGVPGRTIIVGNLTILPSSKPLREKSFNRISQVCFCAPYEDCGIGNVASSTTVYSEVGPNTARLDGKMTLIPGFTFRSVSIMWRIESMFTFRPSSRFSSAAPDMIPCSRYTCV